MPASRRHRARYNGHEARLSPSSCCLSLSLPACTQQSVCRGAAWASSLDLLAFSGERGRSRALVFAVLNGTSIPDPKPVNFSRNPENWAYGQTLPLRLLPKTSSPSVSLLALQVYRCLIGFSNVWLTILAITRTLVTTLHFLMCPNNSGVLVFAECYVATTLRTRSPQTGFRSVRGREG